MLLIEKIKSLFYFIIFYLFNDNDFYLTAMTATTTFPPFSSYAFGRIHGV